MVRNKRQNSIRGKIRYCQTLSKRYSPEIKAKKWKFALFFSELEEIWDVIFKNSLLNKKFSWREICFRPDTKIFEIRAAIGTKYSTYDFSLNLSNKVEINVIKIDLEIAKQLFLLGLVGFHGSMNGVHWIAHRREFSQDLVAVVWTILYGAYCSHRENIKNFAIKKSSMALIQ